MTPLLFCFIFIFFNSQQHYGSKFHDTTFGTQMCGFSLVGELFYLLIKFFLHVGKIFCSVKIINVYTNLLKKKWDEKSFCAEQHCVHFWVGVEICVFTQIKHQQRLMVSFGSVLSLIKWCKNWSDDFSLPVQRNTKEKRVLPTFDHKILEVSSMFWSEDAYWTRWIDAILVPFKHSFLLFL